MNLVEGLLAETNRVRDVVGHYDEIGPAGAIGAAMIRADISRAEAALGSGDVVAMLQALATLRGIKG